MAHYPTVLQPSYSFHASPSYPQPQVYPSPAFQYPAPAHPVQHAMPTYYVQPTPSSHHSRGRSYSHSGHQQPVVYTTSSGSGRPHMSSRDYAYGDSGRRRRSSSVGHGGHYYYPSQGHATSHRSSSRSPVYYTTSSPGRRSHSTTRHHHSSSGSGTQYADVHHRSGSRRPSVSYSDSGHHSGHSSRRNSDSLGDRFRRWFGGWGSSSQHHHQPQSRSRGVEYVDARSGRPVDRSGRPIYRV